MNNQDIELIYELSPMQQAMLFHSLYAPGSGVYVIQLSLRLTGRLDVGAFERAWRLLFERHDALRTAFFWEDLEKPLQVVYRKADLPLQRLSWRGLDPEEREARLAAFVAADLERGFDLSAPPLMRLTLIELDDDVHQLVWSQHHIAVDGWSRGQLLRELFAAYAAFAQGREPRLERVPGYREYIAWLQRQDLGQAEAFWKQNLAGFDEPTLVLGGEATEQGPSFRESRLRELPLSEETSDALREVGRKNRLTLNTLVQGAWALLLAQRTGRDEVVFGTTVAGRPADLPGVESIVGLFINTLPVRLEIDPERRLRDWLAELQKHQVETRRYEHSPLVEVQRWSGLPPRTPLFDHILVFENLGIPSDLSGALPGLAIEAGAANSLTNYPLSVIVLPERRLTLTMLYHSERFTEAEVDGMLARLAQVLEAFAAEGDPRLGELSLLLPQERRQLEAWAPGPGEAFAGPCLHELFAAQAARTPEAVALVHGTRRVTYAGLAARAGGIARRLLEMGAGPEVRIAVCLERSPDLIAALLGILASGAAYVPVDPAYPADRRAFMLADSGAAVLVTRGALAADLPETGARVLDLDAEAIPDAGLPEGTGAEPGNLAYLIYTSGSTGRPKAVAIEHRNAVALMGWARGEFSDEELGGVMAGSSVCFDLSVFEIFAPLSWGGKFILAENTLALPTLPAAAEVRLLNTVPSAVAELVRVGGIPPSVKTVTLAGETLPGPLAARIYATSKVERLVNQYGPSEDTTFSTGTFTPRGLEGPPPIGRPFPGTRIWIVDRRGALVPPGVAGEVWLAGAGLARGYLGRPDLTAEKFIPDPFSGGPGERVYRSGDLARYLPDGQLDFVARVDHQVKIRGFRIELGEIEEVLASHPRVAECAVLAREDVPGSRILVAYVAGEGASDAELRAWLGAKLPEYMVPSVFVRMEALPRSPNRKVERKALPAPERGAGPEGEAPRTPAEEVLAGIWSDILKVDRVGREDDFFALGGHSLLATQVVSRVRQAFDVELPLRALFEARTLAALAQEVETARIGGASPTAPPIVPAPRDGGLPLSFGQRRLWLIDQIEPGDPSYNVPWGARLRGDLDPGVLRRTFAEMARRHESLRTTFTAGAPGSGEPAQVVHESVEISLPVVSLEGLPAGMAAAEAERLAAGEVLRRFNLATGPLLRLTLLRLGVHDHVLLATMHHIVSDGWSMGVLLREIMTLYGAFARGEGSPLPELPVQYADFAVWQRGWLQGEALEAQLAYWRGQLAGAPPRLDLPTDRPRPEAMVHRGGVQWTAFDAELSRDLAAFSREEGATLFMTLLAAYGALLGRLAHQRDVLVGSPIANRQRRELEELIGFFINTLVLRVPLGGGPTFRELVGRTRQVALDAYTHQDLPFERLVEEVAPERNLSHSPVFQVMLAFQDHPAAPPAVAGLKVAPLRMARTVAQYDLSLAFAETPEGLAGGLAYDAEIFDLATAERLLARFEQLLRAGLADPDRSIEELPLLLAAEREEILYEWNDTAVRYPGAESTLHELVEARAARSPEAVAVSSEEGSLTYGELERRANRLARFLRRLGVGPEARVGIAVERSPEMVVAVLGVLKAGGAYLPLDPEAPRDRLAAMLEDGAARVVVSRQGLAAVLPDGDFKRVWLDADAERIALESGERILSGAGGDHLAYVIYTSGSTGRPKGVMVSHRSILNRLLWMQDRYPMAPGDVLLQKTPLTFDASVWELFVPLFAGARLELARPGGHRDSEYLVQRVKEAGVTVLQLVPSQLRVFLDQPGVEECAGLRRLFCGGEALPESLRERAFELLGIERMCNLYGPTEASIDASSQECRRGEPVPGGIVPIGRPIGNLRLFVLDEELDLAPVGVAGELYIGGVNLARGYAARPDLTADRFVPDGASGLPGERLYRTGDRARHLSDGRIEYMGRLDNQVKIRGVRIEPGEIEALLRRHPAVREAVVIAREDTPGDRRLVAYLEGDAVPEAGELRGWLQQSLPEVMVPSAFVTLDKLPQLPNGKLDRGALPAPSAVPSMAEASAPASRGPRTPVEELVAQAWREVLGLERVGAEESFFELGGHSLLVFQVVTRLRETFKVKVPLRALFNAPTVAALAAEIEKLLRAGGGVEAPPIEPVPRSGALATSFAQQRLWLIDQLGPGSPAYNLPAAVRLTGGLSVGLLRGVFAEVVRRHESLRTTFAAPEGWPVQVINPPSPPDLPLVDLSALPESRREGLAHALALEEARRPFDLQRGPLLRLSLVRLAERDHLLLMTMHHIVSDGWSTGVLLRELGALHAAFSQGRPSPLPELPVQYADFAAWQRSWLQGEVLEAQLAYWRRQLEGAPRVLELPTDRPRRIAAARRGVSLPVVLSPGLSEGVRALCLKEGVTPFMALLAAWSVLLGRLAGQEDVLVGSPVAGRNRREVEDLIGFFVNTLVLRARLAGSPAFGELLGRVREAALDAYTHQDLPFERLVEEVVAERDLAVSPLFQVLFVLQSPVGGAISVPGLTLTPLAVDSGVAKVDLTLTLLERADHRFAGSLEYDADLFDAGTAARLMARFEVLLAGLLADPGRPVTEPPLLLAAEREQVLVELNDTRSAYPREESIPGIFAAVAAASPEAPAMVDASGETWSYRRLDEASDRLARRLGDLGVAPGSRVGIAMARSADLLVGLLGILKAGAAYVPLDPGYPDERLAWLVEDSSVEVALVHGPTRERLAGLPVPHLLALDEAVAAGGQGTLPARVPAEALAYVIYTSGSTGRPKGVAVPHRAILRLVMGTSYLELGPDDRLAFNSNTSFDAATFEIWGTLLHGGALVAIPQDLLLSPEELGAALRRERVTVLHLTTALFNRVVREAPEILPPLRCALFGGEASDPAAVALALERPPKRLLHMYGPTETTTFATCHPVTALAPGAATVPIGRPISNSTACLLDPWGGMVPPGTPGELFLGGDGVAWGYLNRPDLTAERFVPDPWSGDPGARLYRTGDLVTFRPGGALEFQGRIDLQVKIRGYRIEPGEVEALLASLPGVAACAVLARRDGPGDARLAAYVVPAEGSGLTEGALREELKRTLPDYMLPSAVMFLDALPLTPNGKVDRKALPAPEAVRPDLAGEYVAPQGPIAETLAAIWAELLGIDRVGARDNFFDLGGHSLLATQVAVQIWKRLDVRLPLRELFLHPTIESLAERLEREMLERVSADRLDDLLEMLEGMDEEEAAKSLESGVES